MKQFAEMRNGYIGLLSFSGHIKSALGLQVISTKYM
jgi:hypothetical protein